MHASSTENNTFELGQQKPTKVTVGEFQSPEKQTCIAVEKDGESVSAIRVTCRCGEEILIKCKYSGE